jgi:hypothetical protein
MLSEPIWRSISKAPNLGKMLGHFERLREEIASDPNGLSGGICW